jgi:hypothetical protein
MESTALELLECVEKCGPITARGEPREGRIDELTQKRRRYVRHLQLSLWFLHSQRRRIQRPP